MRKRIDVRKDGDNWDGVEDEHFELELLKAEADLVNAKSVSRLVIALITVLFLTVAWLIAKSYFEIEHDDVSGKLQMAACCLTLAMGSIRK